jgi:hypothetical protein
MVSEAEMPDDFPKRRTLRDLEMELREEYSTDLRAEWDLKDPSWKCVSIPPSSIACARSLRSAR